MKKIWFTADTHFGHTNIIKYCHRPFRDIEEHDKILQENWNKTVAPEDEVYHLGDVMFWRPQPNLEPVIDKIQNLNGTIYHVMGNHDSPMEKIRKWHRGQLRRKLYFLRDLPLIRVKNQDIVLSHYAMRVWDKSHHGSWNLYGHSHGTLPDDPHLRGIDIGVDCFDYKPVDFDTISAIMEKKLWKPLDHHRPKEETGGHGYSREEYAKLERKAIYESLKREFENEENT